MIKNMKRIIILLLLITFMFAFSFFCQYYLLADDYLDNDRASPLLIASGEEDRNQLHYYIMTCRYKKVEKMLKKGGKANEIIESYNDLSPLMIAATLPRSKDAIKMSKLLIKYGANVNLVNKYGANVLYYTIFYGHESSENNIEVLDFYLKQGTNQNIIMKYFDEDYNLSDKNGKVLTLLEFCDEAGYEKERSFLESYSKN